MRRAQSRSRSTTSRPPATSPNCVATSRSNRPASPPGRFDTQTIRLVRRWCLPSHQPYGQRLTLCVGSCNYSDAEEYARPVRTLHCDLQLATGGLDIFAKGVHAAGADLAVLHLRHTVLPDADFLGKSVLGVPGILTQFSESVLGDLTVHLDLDTVDPIAVARTTLPHVIESGHRFFSFRVFDLLALVASASCLCSRSWWAVNSASATGMFLSYHLDQFPALSPATSMIALDRRSNANSARV